MLVKVKVKATGNVQVITKKAYEFAKKLYVYLGDAPKDADLHEYGDQQTPTATSQVVSITESLPNKQTTVTSSQKGVESGAEPVVFNQAPVTEPKRRGRKPNQISSSTAVAEV